MPNPHTPPLSSQPPPYQNPFLQRVKHEVPPPSTPSSEQPSSVSHLRTSTRFTNPKTTHSDPRFYPPQARGCCTPTALMASIHPSECEECAQSCQDGTCSVEFTDQCTSQCVVVACNESHQERDSCKSCNIAPPCELMCTDSAECPGLDEILQCCSDYPPIAAFNKMSFPDISGQQNVFDWNSTLLYNPHTLQGTPDQSGTNNIFQSTDGLSLSGLGTSPTAFASSHDAMSSPVPQHPAIPSALPSQTVSHALKCMWGNCTESFSSMSELVGHVNLQHLRLPSTGAPEMSQQSTPSAPFELNQKVDGMRTAQASLDSLSCLWADCHLYPTPNSVPGPSSGDPINSALGVLASHLLQDHLGLPNPSPQTIRTNEPTSPVSPIWEPHPRHAEATTAQAGGITTPPQSTTSSNSQSPEPACPPTPTPEHDCNAPSAHVCRWIGCGQKFANCDDLTAHINATHVGSGKAHYDCYWEGCARNGESGFASKQKICRHLQSHTGHRPFQCKVCQQNFSEAATLAQHMRRHTQEKPYVCDFPGCGKSFAITGALTIHKRTHNGHKPFKCTYCDRAFAESSNLSKHLRTHTGARPYPCTHPGCNKSFARPDQLARHASVHKKKKLAAGVEGTPTPSGSKQEVMAQ